VNTFQRKKLAPSYDKWPIEDDWTALLDLIGLSNLSMILLSEQIAMMGVQCRI